MRFAEVTREILLDDKATARRDSWDPYKIIKSGFSINDLLQQRYIVVVSNKNSSPNLYYPTSEDIMANDWRLL